MKHFMKGRLLVVLAVCALLAVASPVQAAIASALHGPGTPYPAVSPVPMTPGVTTSLYAPPGPPNPVWNVYGSPNDLTDAGFTTDYGDPIAELISPFDKQQVSPTVRLKGTIQSEVYRHGTDGHLLFVYTITNDNDSTDSFSTANLIDWDSIAIIDAGEITLEAGIQAFYSYGRLSGSPGELSFVFYDKTNDVGDYLDPGEVSTHAYAETDATFWTRGIATVQDGGVSESPIPVLVPTFIPEPLTMVGLFFGLGSVGAYIRKRRMA